ncbi:hypothetical protein P3T76_003783 [Phytophthora citrophthora]|uniref:Uncharacterized protein n=1 Tax=Phytophthora citrophthora TaxID=4793 RepID=A0AAD9GUN9_9STRA|nr:hypothetical protein P3T76_003783 [Phytophthora citrophthora]
MNGYLRSKCSSEQQLLNELAKLLGSKDVASRKMADVLRALTFFYTSAARGSRIPQSLLSGLCSLLPQLKDKKEITLLKDEHQRIARIALCLLGRLIDQFEIQKEMTTRLMDSQEQNVDPAEQVLTSFLLTLETAVTTPPGLLLPRQRATLRVYAQLCRVFSKREQLVTHATTLLQQSPVLAYVENPMDAKGKRLPPPAPAQYGAITGACHALRFHTAPDEQIFAVDKLTQLAFMTPASAASRHAAKTLLSLVTSSVLKEGKQTNAVTTAKAVELYLLKTRPRVLLNGDSLTSVYLLRLCGQLYRLPVHQQQQSSATNSEASTIPEPTLLESSSSAIPKPTTDQNPALHGYFVSNTLSAQIQEYLIDVVQAAVPNDPTAKPTVGPAVLLVAVEEVLRGTSPEASFRKQPNWGSKCLFELVAAALLSLLPASQDSTRLAYSTVMLHRICRAVQFAAERLDAVVLQLSAAAGEMIVVPLFLNELKQRILSLTLHSNAFVACEALRAFVWLLPRGGNSVEIGADWENVFWQLESLPFNRIQPERRAAIAWTLFRRCVTTLKAYGYNVEAPLLSGCLRVVLAWFRLRPCVWHAAMLTAIWHTALRECLVSLGDDVFSSINDLFDYHCDPSNSAAPDCLVVKQSGLQFLSHREGGMKYAVRSETWSRPLVLRLTKQALLETSTSQRMSARALTQMRDEAQAQEFTQLAQQIDAALSILQKKSRHLMQANTDGVDKPIFSLHEDPFEDVTSGAATDVDPFSDFRAPEKAPASKVTNSTIHDDPFADVAAASSMADSSFSNWSGDTSTIKSATEPPSSSDFKTLGGNSTNNFWGDSDDTQGFISTKPETLSTPAFSSWDGENTVTEAFQTTKTDDPFFGNFSVSEVSTNLPFGIWATSEKSFSPSTPETAAFSTDFGAAETADFGSPADTPAFDGGTDAERRTSFTADTAGRASSFTADAPQSSVSASTPETAAFSTDFGAAETADFGSPADTPAFDGGTDAERRTSFTADTAGRASSFTADAPQSSVSASTPETAAFSTDFGAAETADFGSPADTPAFDGGTDAERRTSFTADTAGRASSFTADAPQSSVSASTPETAAFSTDFGAAETADFGSPADTPAFDGGTDAERRTSFTADTAGRASSFTADAPQSSVSASTPETAAFSTDFGAAETADFGSPADTPAFDGGTDAERRTSFTADTAGRASSFTADAPQSSVSASTPETAAFSTDFGAAETADFGSPADTPAFDGGTDAERRTSFTADTAGRASSFTADAPQSSVSASTPETAAFSTDFGAAETADFGSPADTPAFDGGTDAERRTSFTADTAGRASSFTADAPQSSVSASTPETAAFSTDFGAAETADFGSPADTPAFDGGTDAERRTSFTADTAGRASSFTADAPQSSVSASTPETAAFSTDFGAAETADFGSPADTPAFDGGTDAERRTSFTADTAGRASSFTADAPQSSVSASTPETAAFSTDFGAAETADFGSPADTPAFDGGTDAERRTSFTADTAGRASSFTADAPQSSVSASTPETAAFSTDFGAAETADFGSPADTPAFDGGTDAERRTSFTADTAGRASSFTADAPQSSVSASTPETAAFSTDFGAAETADFGSPADTPAFDGGTDAERRTSFTADTAGRASSFTADAPQSSVSASTPETAAFSTDFGAAETADFGSPADTPAFDGGTDAERRTSFTADTAGRASSFTADAPQSSVSASTPETAAFSTDFGAAETADFGSPADTPAFDGGTDAERRTSFTADTAGRASSFTADAPQSSVSASTPETAAFSTDFGAAETADFGSPADTPAFDGGTDAERRTSFTADTAGRASSFTADAPQSSVSASTPETAAFSTDFGAAETADFGSPADTPAFDGGTDAERRTSFTADTAGRASSFTADAPQSSVSASTPETAAFSTDFGAAETADFGSPADTPAFDGGTDAERRTSFTADTAGRASSFTADAPQSSVSASTPETAAFSTDFGAAETADFGSPADTPAFDGGTDAERRTSFTADTAGRASSFTADAPQSSVSASTPETAAFSTDFGAAETADFGSPADTPAFDGGTDAERRTSFTADTAGRASSFTADAPQSSVSASTPETAAFSTDFGAAETADFGSPADTPAFDGGTDAERRTSFTADTAGRASSFTADAPQSSVSASTPETAAFSTDFGAAETADFGSPADTPAFDGGTDAERRTSFTADTAGRASSFTADAPQSSVSASTPETAAFSTDFGAAETADFGSPADTPAFDGGTDAERRTSFTADTAGRASSFTADAPQSSVSASTPETAAFSTDFGAAETADFGSPADTPAFDGGTDAERRTSFTADTAGRASSFTADAPQSSVSASTPETAAFSTDFGAAETADFGSPADTPAFDGGTDAERRTSFTADTAGRASSFTADAPQSSVSASTPETAAFSTDFGAAETADFGSPADTPAFDGGTDAERRTSFTADTAGRASSFTADAPQSSVSASTPETAAFSTDFGAAETADFGSPADTPAFDGGTDAERRTSFTADTAGRASSFTADAPQSSVSASTPETAAFSTDFGAAETADFGSPADTPAFDGGTDAERRTSFTADTAGRASSFTADAPQSSVSASTPETAAFSTDFGAAETADFGSPADTPAFDGGTDAERRTSFTADTAGRASSFTADAPQSSVSASTPETAAFSTDFGAAETADFGSPADTPAFDGGTDAERRTSFTADTAGRASSFTADAPQSSVSASTPETAAFSTDFGAAETADFGSPADTPAFDGGTDAERRTSFTADTAGRASSFTADAPQSSVSASTPETAAFSTDFGAAETADFGSPADTPAFDGGTDAERRTSFTADTAGRASSFTADAPQSSVSASTPETAAFSTDFGAAETADFGSPADTPAFDGGTDAERRTSFTADTAGRASSFTADAPQSSVSASTPETAAFSTDFGAAETADFGSPADTPAFDGGTDAERRTSFTADTAGRASSFTADAPQSSVSASTPETAAFSTDFGAAETADFGSPADTPAFDGGTDAERRTSFTADTAGRASSFTADAPQSSVSASTPETAAFSTDFGAAETADFGSPADTPAFDGGTDAERRTSFTADTAGRASSFTADAPQSSVSASTPETAAFSTDFGAAETADFGSPADTPAFDGGTDAERRTSFTADTAGRASSFTADAPQSSVSASTPETAAFSTDFGAAETADFGSPADTPAFDGGTDAERRTSFTADTAGRASSFTADAPQSSVSASTPETAAFSTDFGAAETADFGSPADTPAFDGGTDAERRTSFTADTAGRASSFTADAPQSSVSASTPETAAFSTDFGAAETADFGSPADTPAFDGGTDAERRTSFTADTAGRASSFTADAPQSSVSASTPETAAFSTDFGAAETADFGSPADTPAFDGGTDAERRTSFTADTAGRASSFTADAPQSSVSASTPETAAFSTDFGAAETADFGSPADTPAFDGGTDAERRTSFTADTAGRASSFTADAPQSSVSASTPETAAFSTDFGAAETADFGSPADTPAFDGGTDAERRTSFTADTAGRASSFTADAPQSSVSASTPETAAFSTDFGAAETADFGSPADTPAFDGGTDAERRTSFTADTAGRASSFTADAPQSSVSASTPETAAFSTDFGAAETADFGSPADTPAFDGGTDAERRTSFTADTAGRASSFTADAPQSSVSASTPETAAFSTDFGAAETADFGSPADTPAFDGGTDAERRTSFTADTAGRASSFTADAPQSSVSASTPETAAFSTDFGAAETADFGSPADTPAFDGGTDAERRTSFTADTAGRASSFTADAPQSSVSASTPETAAFSTDFGAAETADFGSPADTPAFDGGTDAERRTSFTADTAGRASSFTADAPQSSVSASTPETAAFSTDFGAAETADFGSPADTPAFDGGTDAERRTSFTADTAGRASSFTADAPQSSVSASTPETAAFSTDFGAAETADFGSPADTPAFDGGTDAERRTSFTADTAGRASSFTADAPQSSVSASTPETAAFSTDFGAAETADFGSPADTPAFDGGTDAERRTSFTADTAGRASSFTADAPQSSVSASTPETAAFSTDFGAAETADFGSPADTPAFDGGTDAERRTSFTADTAGRASSFTADAPQSSVSASTPETAAFSTDFGAAETADFGSPADTPAFDGGTDAERRTSFTADTAGRASSFTADAPQSSVSASTPETAAFSTDFGAAETADFGSPADTPAFDGGTDAERRTSFTADTAGRASSFTADAPQSSVSASTPETAAFSTDFGAAETADFGSPADTPAFDGGTDAERRTSFTADTAGRASSFTADAPQSSVSASTPETAAFSTDFGAAETADFGSPADTPAFDGGTDAERRTSFTADTAGRASSFTADAPQSSVSASTPETAAFSTDFGAAETADFGSPADTPAFDGGTDAERRTSFTADTAGRASSFTADAPQSSVSASTPETAAFSTDFGAAETADFGSPADTPAFDGGTDAERRTSFTADTAGRASSFTADAPQSSVSASTPETAAFSTDFGAAETADFGSPADTPAFDGGTDAERRTSFTADTAGRASSFTADAPQSSVSASTPETAAFSTDFGAAETADFGSPADTPAFDGGTDAERRTSFTADTAGRASSFTADAPQSSVSASTPETAAFSTDFGAAETADFGSPADTPAFDGGTDAERRTSFTADTAGRASSFTADAPQSSVSASTPETAAFSTDFGAAETADFGSPADTPAFDGGTDAERRTSFTADTAGRASSFTADAPQSSVSASTPETAAFSTDFGAAETADFGSPADTPAFDGGTDAERRTSFTADTAGRASSFTADAPQSSVSASTPETAAFSTDFGAAETADFGSPADTPAFDGGTDAERRTSFTADTAGRASSFTADAPQSSVSASTPETAAFSTDFGAAETADFGSPADTPAFDGGTDAERRTSFTADTAGRASSFTADAPQSSVSASTPETAAFSTDFGAAETADFGSPADTPAFDGGTDAERRTSFTADTAGRASSFTADAPQSSVSASTPETAAFSTDFGAAETADFGSPADTPAFDGGTDAERRTSFTADTAGRASSFTADAPQSSVSASTPETAAFSTDFGAAETADFGSPADTPAFDGGTDAERRTSFTADTAGRASSFTADAPQSSVSASTPETAAFSTDFGAAETADFGSPADTPAFDGGTDAERRTSFTADTAGRASSFTADAPQSSVSASTPETAAFSTDFGAAETADFGSPADTPAFDGGTDAERRTSFTADTAGRASSFTADAPQSSVSASTPETAAFSTDFGAAETADFGSPADTPAFDGGTDAERRTSFTADTAGRASSFTADAPQSSVSASTPETAAFSTDFGAAETADFGSPADTPAFDGGTDAERRTSFTADTAGRASSFTADAPQSSVSASTPETAAFLTDFDVNSKDVSQVSIGGDEVEGTCDDELVGVADDIAEYEAASNDGPPASVDEFDEIFGDSSAATSEPTADFGEIPTLLPSTGKYDAEFDDIFGEEASAREGTATSADLENMVSTSANSGKKHSLDEDSRATLEVEVRTGTPASDFSLN